MDEEPEVFRMWMPEQNCPGLAMVRAFGDFCLKDFGLISTPEVSYRRLTDEFVVLATDGVSVLFQVSHYTILLDEKNSIFFLKMVWIYKRKDTEVVALL